MPLPSLPDECFINVFLFLLDDKSLYKCLFVNRYYCKLTIPIIWKDPFNHSHQKELTDTLLSCLVDDEISLLISCAGLAKNPRKRLKKSVSSWRVFIKYGRKFQLL